MRKIGCFLLVSILSFGVIGCSTKEKDTNSSDITNVVNEAVSVSPTKAPHATKAPVITKAADEVFTEGSVVEVEIESEAIAKNIIGDNATRKVYVYLPPSYQGGNKKYPVVYFMHGYGDSSKGFMNSYKDKLDKEFNDDAKEFILVAFDGNNKTGGSFYVNSPSSGNWEDFSVNEVVNYIDSNYRTIADCNSRGIAGYSMGGFGALYLGMRHPDLFNSVLVYCPGVCRDDEFDIMLASWNGWSDVKRSYAQAFSPDVNNTQFYGNIIKDSDVEEKNAVWEDWMNGYCNWEQKVDDYLALNTPLKSIMIAYCPEDVFSWIPSGCEYLAGLYKKKDVNYSTYIFSGGHIVPTDAIETNFVPFFGENLTY